jgi:hypothetical protein
MTLSKQTALSASFISFPFIFTTMFLAPFLESFNITYLCEISSSRSGKYEDDRLLGYSAV